MPFTLLAIGLVLLVAAVRNTQDDLFALVKGDFTGQKNFVYWILAFLVVGAIGRIPKLKPFSNAFLVLIIIVIFISNKGFFAKFQEAIGSTQISQQKV
jgi:hypothetical protein